MSNGATSFSRRHSSYGFRSNKAEQPLHPAKAARNAQLSKAMILLLAIMVVYPVYVTGRLTIGLGVFVLIGAIYFLLNTKRAINSPLVLRYLIFLFTLVPAVFLSSSLSVGIAYFILCLLPLPVLLAGYSLVGKVATEELLSLICVIAIPLGVANIIFWVSPDLESLFLESDLAHVLIQPSVLDEFLLGVSNNVSDPNKAGTLFVNANNASVMYSIFFALSCCLFLRRRKGGYLILGVLYLGATLATGSRSGILVVALLGVIALLWRARHNKSRLRSEAAILFILILVMAAILVAVVSPELYGRLQLSILSADPRIGIWEYVLKLTPFYGAGFDGWDYLRLAIPDSYLRQMPPHNHILTAYSWGGIVCAVGYLLFWLGGLANALRSLWRSPTIDAAVAFVVYTSVFLHGCFDNYFLSYSTLLVFVFILLGLSCNCVEGVAGGSLDGDEK